MRRPAAWPAVTLSLTLALAAVVLSDTVANREDDELARRTETHGAYLARAVRERIDSDIDALVRMRQRWERIGGTPREVWTADAASYAALEPGLQAVEWADTDDRIRWIEPLEGNETAIDLDLRADPVRRRTMDRARQRDAPAQTPPIELVQGGMGFLVYVPLTVDGQPDGTIIGVFRIDELLRDIAAVETAAGIALTLTSEGRTFYRSVAAETVGSGEISFSSRVPVVDGEWTLTVAPLPALAAAVRSRSPEVILLAGLLVALLLPAAIYFAQLSRLHRLEVVVANRELESRVRRAVRGEREMAGRLAVERDLLSSVLRSVGDPVLVMDSDGEFTMWNPAAESFLEIHEEQGETRGERPLGVYRSDGKTLYDERDLPLQRAIRGESIDSEDVFLRNPRVPDGRWVSVTARPLIDEDGRTVGGVAVLRDTSEARRRWQAERFERLFESLPTGVIACEADGSITMMNPRALSLFDCGPEEVAGQAIGDLIPSLEVADLARRAAAGESGEAPLGGDLTALGSNGRAFPVELGVAEVTSEEGTIYVTSIVDITDRKAAEEALRTSHDVLEARVAERTADLARSNEELKQFAYVASHDLQEPLRMIAGFTGLLAQRYRGQLDEEADEFIQYAIDGATRMQAMISSLLEYSRVGTQKRVLAEVDLDAALQNALRNLQVSIEESGAHISADALPTILGDEQQMVRLFQNLIGNAMKFCRAGERPEVRIEVSGEEGEWQISVADNGIGIEPEYADKIFVIFQRLNRREDFPGTGIGLSICKRIVERHGGRIWMTSTPGEGTTFAFALPTMATVETEDREAVAV